MPELRLNSRDAAPVAPLYPTLSVTGLRMLVPVVKVSEGLQMKSLEGGWALGLAAGIAGGFFQAGGDASSLGEKGGAMSELTRDIGAMEKTANQNQTARLKILSQRMQVLVLYKQVHSKGSAQSY